MPGKGDFLSNEILDHVLSQNTFTPPTSLWVALFTAVPTPSGGGTEVTAGDYERVNFSSSTNNWTLASQNIVVNLIEFAFAQATSAWGTIVGFGLFDNSVKTSGNLMYWASLTSAKSVLSGETGRFPSGTLIVRED